MSDTANDTRALHAVPDPEPLAGLTGAPAAVYAELAKLTGDDGATAAEVALAASLGRSTTGKALVTLERHGLAVRTPGGHDGPRRAPDHWRAAPTPGANSGDGPGVPEPAPTEPVPSANMPEPDTHHTDDESTPAGATTPDSEKTSTSHETSVTASAAADAPHDTPTKEGKHPREDSGHKAGTHRDGGSDGPEPENALVPQESPEQPTAAAMQTPIPPGEKKRLAPGALRQMVTDHLTAHPREAFTATKISRVIEKSSGAIANALIILTRQGIAEQVTDKPRTYRATTSEADTE